MKHNGYLSRKLLAKALVTGFVLTVLASFFPFAAACGELPENVVRLHVVANSDSPEDQAVKLQVRDAVLQEAARWYGEANTMEEASALLCTHLESIAQAARDSLKEQGVSYGATAQVTEMYFSTRTYETFQLPAGRYRTLRVTLGQGQGKNWWCVVFPTLCLPAASQDEEDALLSFPQSEREIVENPEQFQIRFKAVELWEELREWLRG